MNQAVSTVSSGNTDNVIELVAATKDLPVTLHAIIDAQVGQSQASLPNDGAMLVGAGANDRLIGSKGQDLLVGGKGSDHFIGGRGADLMFGGEGVNCFPWIRRDHGAPADDLQATGLEGNDWIDGGSGTDTLDYAALKQAINHNLSTRRPAHSVLSC